MYEATQLSSIHNWKFKQTLYKCINILKPQLKVYQSHTYCDKFPSIGNLKLYDDTCRIFLDLSHTSDLLNTVSTINGVCT